MRKAAILVPILAAFSLSPSPVWAERSGSDGTTTTVAPISAGPVVSDGSAGFDHSGTQASARSQGAEPSGSAGASATAPGTGSDITFRQIPFNAVPSGGVWVDQSGTIHLLPAIPVSACPPGQTGFYTYDANGAPLGIVCVGNGANPPAGAPTPSPLALAEQASAEQPWPVLQFGINPTVGLTGLPSWFWLGGNPQMPDATASAGPLTVRVHAELIDVVWRFGDGAGLSTGTNVGQPSSKQVSRSSVRNPLRCDAAVAAAWAGAGVA
jgi:hypothetical protein